MTEFTTTEDSTPDLWQLIQENRSDLDEVAGRDDRLGALASIALDLADGEHPSDEDLEQVGVGDVREVSR